MGRVDSLDSNTQTVRQQFSYFTFNTCSYTVQSSDCDSDMSNCRPAQSYRQALGQHPFYQAAQRYQHTTCERYNMKINIIKTEKMHVSRTPSSLNIHLKSTPLKQVKEFKYLGSMITEDSRLD